MFTSSIDMLKMKNKPRKRSEYQFKKDILFKETDVPENFRDRLNK